jgi:holo-[acyl-carrier protein] synthase
MGRSLMVAEPVGVGIDQVMVADFERQPFVDNKAFYERLFSADEIAYCLGQAAPAQHFAARYAAKEAAVKACSAIVPLAYWQVEVRRATDGAPSLQFWNEARSGPQLELRSIRALISLSHTETVASAVVVLCARNGANDGH